MIIIITSRTTRATLKLTSPTGIAVGVILEAIFSKNEHLGEKIHLRDIRFCVAERESTSFLKKNAIEVIW